MKYIKMSNGMKVKVDNENYLILNKYTWRLSGGYVVRHQQKGEYRDLRNRGVVRMHHMVMNPKKRFIIDHINHDVLDNRKSNLRIATSSQNSCNRRKSENYSSHSKYKGVSFYKKSGKWTSSLKNDNKNIYLGCFNSETEAARAYKVKSRELFGNFAFTNYA